MSISTLESPASRAALAELHASSDRISAAESSVREEVKQAFAMVGIVSTAMLALPAPDFGKNRVGSVTVRAAVLDMLGDGQCEDELVAVLEGSKCPLVDALLNALRDRYAERNATEVAELRS